MTQILNLKKVTMLESAINYLNHLGLAEFVVSKLLLFWKLLKAFVSKVWHTNLTGEGVVSKSGLEFEFNHYLCSKKDNKGLVIAGVQVGVRNVAKKFIEVDDAYILSNLTGQKVEIKVDTATNKNYVSFGDLVSGFPPRSKQFRTCADLVEGLDRDEFLKEFGNFSYVIVCSGKKIVVKKITEKNIKALLSKTHDPKGDSSGLAVKQSIR